ncbi:DBH-like monooxygenase protein 1 [Desmophyllum pertusum]|uniref:DBH-like monooxygenase protein 1 n=1 Tax=Desmophyllum pertusum TaxID=174260 RepID=A0A9W9YP25_9CNID|nr:DBH-like monooxygenase protein 1 [Desmophyllum pertusum]
MAVLVGLLLCLAAFQSTVSADLHSDYAHYAVLDPAEKMKLFWTADWDAKTVSFAVEAETTGWIELGFSDGTGDMVGSDVVIGWVKDNKGYLTDRFVTSDSIPTIDKQQDYELTGSQESGGKTVLKFKRKFDTCDQQDRRLEKGVTNVVYAYGTEDPVSPMNIDKEVSKGSRSVLLLSKRDIRNIDKTGWTSFAMTANLEPIIKEGNEGLVHHYVLSGCHGNFTESDFHEGVHCLAGSRIMYTKCQKRHMVAVWTVGGEAVYLPSHVGVPIGGNHSPNVFLLEIVYDNPQQIKGRQDSSGVKVYYTNKLQEYDSGIISPMFNSTSLPGGGIKVFAAMIHIHWAGHAGWTKHVRNGKKLPEIARLNNYDFDFQVGSVRFFPKICAGKCNGKCTKKRPMNRLLPVGLILTPGKAQLFILCMFFSGHAIPTRRSSHQTGELIVSLQT